MNKEKLLEELMEVLNWICVEIGERPTGSEKNKQLESYAKSYFEANAYDVQLQQFPCIDWEDNGAKLIFNGEEIIAKPSYYTTACDLEAEYVKLATVDKLESSNLEGKIALLYDQLTKEQLMPKSFTFYNPEEHQKIISLLEEKNPLAIITVVDNDTSIFEDGDFDIPSVYLGKEDGQALLNNSGKIKLRIDTVRKDSKGANVIARINPEDERKLVITAHMDTKYGTPGALDDGTGIAILLLLSTLIKAKDIDFCLELLLLNGEDYYSTPGQLNYMEEYLADNESIFLVINCDGVGMKDSQTAISFMELNGEKEELVKDMALKRDGIDVIEPWVQGDHMLFVMNGIPAITFTSKEILKLIDVIAHTEKDCLDIIDHKEVLKIILFIEEIIKTFT